MTGGLFDGNIFRSLAFRILLFLTLALLPFGLIAVFQTREVARQAAFNSELSLVALTNQAANAEQAILLEGFGAAETLGSALQLYLGDPQTCSEYLADYTDKSPTYIFAGFIPINGLMTCSSAPSAVDFSDASGFAQRMQEQERQVESLDRGAVSAEPVVTISQPVFVSGEFTGYMILSVPEQRFRAAMVALVNDRPVDLVTFNRNGEFVRSNRPKQLIAASLPANHHLKSLVGNDALVFRDETASGSDRVYTVVPIVSDVIYSLSIWQPENIQAGLGKSITLSIFLPILMWMASLVVAFWSLNRLAVRHIRKLGRQMRLFAYNRRVPHTTMGQGVPLELLEIQKSFVRMADSIVRDEAALEDSLRDKNILLKEVHHRVKNNLQLISSIMNMQIRRAQSEDARAVLKRLQDRILSLATVHKNLYQTDNLDRVDAGVLMDEIISQLLRVGLPTGQAIDVEQSYASIEMDADDAAPLTLLASEAVTNAMKYIDHPNRGGKGRLEISLSKGEDNSAVFRIANTTSGAKGSDGTGLGTQLISAFARQLNGNVVVSFEDELHALELTFPIRKRANGRYDF